MNADKTSVFIGVYRRSSAAIHVLAFFSNLARWRVILLRLLTVAAPIRAARVSKRWLFTLRRPASGRTPAAPADGPPPRRGYGCAVACLGARTPVAGRLRAA